MSESLYQKILVIKFVLTILQKGGLLISSNAVDPGLFDHIDTAELKFSYYSHLSVDLLLYKDCVLMCNSLPEYITGLLLTTLTWLRTKH